jgi:C1A family cysteine protease
MTKRRYDVKKDPADHRDFRVSFDHVEGAALPSKVDLRETIKMPAVFDQGQEGSCTANAGCSAFSILKNVPQTVFSRQFLYRMERNIEGTPFEDSGANMRDIGKALAQFGVCEEPFMPYTQANMFANPSSAAVSNAAQHKIASYARVDGLQGIKQTLALKQKPVLIGFDVYESFESDAVASTGVMPVPNTKKEQQLGGHAVLVVGYIDGDLPGKQSIVVNPNNNPESSITKIVQALEAKVEKLEKVVADLVELVKNIVNPQPEPTPGPQPEPTPTPVPPTPQPTPQPTPAPVDPNKGYLIVRNSWGNGWGDGGYFYMPYEIVNNGMASDFWVLEA